jgi:NAD+ kinase
MKAILFGDDAIKLKPLADQTPGLELVDDDPEVIVCYGGDGTLLAAEQIWPGLPKVPIRNSRRGVRLMPHPPEQVLHRMAEGSLHRTEYMKLQCAVRYAGQDEDDCRLSAMNEFNVHMGRINTAVRFKFWIDDEIFEGDEEIIGDGFVVSTPFGSTAYYKQITRGLVYAGMGVAFKLTTALVNHVVVPAECQLRAQITRGPAILAFDNSPEYFDLKEGDDLLIERNPVPATILTWRAMRHPIDAF